MFIFKVFITNPLNKIRDDARTAYLFIHTSLASLCRNNWLFTVITLLYKRMNSFHDKWVSLIRVRQTSIEA